LQYETPTFFAFQYETPTYSGAAIGGCPEPGAKSGCPGFTIAGHATLDGETLTINGLVGEPDGSRIIRASRAGAASDAVALGTAVADELLENGADTILKSLYAEQE